MLKNITVKELKSILNPSINIIDLRSFEKYNTSHIEFSKNIPYLEMLKNPSKYLNKKNMYYLYCQYGKTSLRLSLLLNKQGFNTINMLGGYQEWLISM